MKIKTYKLKDLQIEKELNNKGTDRKEKYRVASLGPEKPKNNFAIISNNNIKIDQIESPDIKKRDKAPESSSIYNNKNKLLNKDIEKKAMTNIVYTTKKPIREIKGINNNRFNSPEEERKIDSALNIYKKEVSKKTIMEKDKKDNKNMIRSYNIPEPEIKKQLPVKEKSMEKSYHIPGKENINNISQKIENRQNKKIYNTEDSQKSDYKFISKTHKVDPTKSAKIIDVKNFYRIPKDDNLRFVETKMTRSQENLLLGKDADKKMKSKTLDKGRKREIQSLIDQEEFINGIKERIKERYLFNEIDEEDERLAREMDLEKNRS
jgi:hypothetical protein